MNKICTVHQIENMVWMGLLDKFSKADIIVLGDTFCFKKNYYENRNKIRTEKGWEWATVPVQLHNHLSMKDIKISQQTKWEEKYLNKIAANYIKSPYFNTYFPWLSSMILNHGEKLIDLNIILIYKFLEWFGIHKEITFTSQLNLDPNLKSTDLLVEICRKVGADTYLSGPSGKDYLELNKFGDIKVNFHEFTHPIYKQQFEPFIPCLSAIDYLFNEGCPNV